MKILINLKNVLTLMLLAITALSYYGCQSDTQVPPNGKNLTKSNSLNSNLVEIGYVSNEGIYVLTYSSESLTNYIENRLSEDDSILDGPYTVHDLKIEKIGPLLILNAFTINGTGENSISIGAELVDIDGIIFLDTEITVHTCSGFPCSSCKFSYSAGNIFGCDCTRFGYCNHSSATSFYDEFY
jgi:hypothetical protein